MSVQRYGKVASTDPPLSSGWIAINKGRDEGVAPGDLARVVMATMPIRDPDTAECLGTYERMVGEYVVLRVEKRFSLAQRRTDAFGEVPEVGMTVVVMSPAFAAAVARD